jgi:hypothetical protein
MCSVYPPSGLQLTEEPEIVALRTRKQWQDADPPDTGQAQQAVAPVAPQVVFNRVELATILNLYGTKVASGEWRDYAIDFNRERAVFAVYRRASELPLYRIEKTPRLARRQGAYAVTTTGGQILRRGHDLAQVLKVLLKKPKLVGA